MVTTRHQWQQATTGRAASSVVVAAETTTISNNDDMISDDSTRSHSTVMASGTDFKKEDRDSRNAIMNLLQIAQFLTAYQSYFTTVDHSVGPIFRQDLERVLEYRAWKRKLQHYKDQAAIYHAFHHPADDQQDEKEHDNPFAIKMEECRKKLALYQQHPQAAAAVVQQQQQQQQNEEYARIVKIDKLWRRFQIWTCKALAQHAFVATQNNAAAKDNSNNKNGGAAAAAANNHNNHLQHHLWSYPLSLPLAAYSMSLFPLAKDAVKQKGDDQLLPFAKLFDEAYNNNHSDDDDTDSNCLLVPPNHYNVREYTRLCSMMAQLPNHHGAAMQAVHASPLARNARSVQSVSHQAKFHWQPSHLVALWIRAQRSPQALRHLIQLFHVAPVAADAAAALADNNSSNNNDHQPLGVSRHGRGYRVEFRGNHKLVYKRSILCSNLADKISTFAIANQLLCTYPQFVQYWQEQQQQAREQQQQQASSGHQRRQQHNASNRKKTNYHNRKRRRREASANALGKRRRTTASSDGSVGPVEEPEGMLQDDDEQTKELLYACQVFLLRTWARRHAKALQLLYQHPWQVQQQEDAEQTATRQQQQPPLVSVETLKTHLKKQLPNTSDRTLLRIERRIGFGKYNLGGNHGKLELLQHAVTSLVHGYRHCLLSEVERRQRQSPSGNSGNDDNINMDDVNDTVTALQQAQDDFEESCRKFETAWNEAGAIAAARSLFAWTNEAFNMSSTTNGATLASAAAAGTTERAILSSAPAPWLNMCRSCNAVVKEEGSYRTCACCQQVCHSSCCVKEGEANYQATTTKQKGLKSYISAFAPLKELFLVKLPSSSQSPSFHLPNYTGDRASEIAWKLTRVHLSRTHKTAVDTASEIAFPRSRRQLEQWGLNFFLTQLGQDRMDELLEGNSPLWTWKETCGPPPLSIPHVGLIVSKVFDNSPAARSSVLVGDVIVAVQVGESDVDSATAVDEKFCPKKMHTLAHLKNRDEYMLLFQQGSRELDLVIQRPSRPILDEANACLNDLAQAMEIPQAVLDDSRSKSGLLHFCPSCRCETTNSTAKRSVRDTLRTCRAVIRHLGAQWYGPYFWFENHVRVEHVLSLDADAEEEASVNDKLAAVHLQSVSLGRMDQMMKDLLGRQEDDHAMEEDLSMAFFVGNHRLDWAPPALENSPLTLLCRGIQLLLNDYKKSSAFQDAIGHTLLPTMEMRKALASDFVRLFSCWCLVLPAETHISLKGPYPHALFADVPSSMSRCCASCRVRLLPSDGDTVSAICDVCQSVGIVQTTSSSDNEPHPLTRLGLQIQRYQERARFVGCSILLLPDDPLLQETTNELSSDNIAIEHCGRPFEYLVVSYIPSSMRECGEEEDAGVFHLLPIVSVVQMKYLLQRCQFRKRDQDGLKDETIQNWKKDGLLDLAGVLQLSLQALTAKVDATARIMDSVSDEVARLARCTCDKTIAQLERCFQDIPHNDNENDNEKVVRCSNPTCCAFTKLDMEGSFPWQHDSASDALNTSFLIDAGLQAGSPVMTAMIPQELGIETPSSDMLEEDESGMPGPKRISGNLVPLVPQEIGKQFLSSPQLSIQSALAVAYSDLYFDSQAELLRFETSVSGALALENPNSQHVDKLTVVLLKHTSPSGCDCSFENGWGWGFEIICWLSRHVISVGRVHRGGHAFASGLRSGDVLAAINGNKIGRSTSFVELLCAILSIPTAMVPIGKQRHDSLRSVLHWISTQQRPLGPVILDVRRASASFRPPQANVRSLTLPHSQQQQRHHQTIQVNRTQTIDRQQVLVSHPTKRPVALSRPQLTQKPLQLPLRQEPDSMNNSRVSAICASNRDSSGYHGAMPRHAQQQRQLQQQVHQDTGADPFSRAAYDVNRGNVNDQQRHRRGATLPVAPRQVPPPDSLSIHRPPGNVVPGPETTRPLRHFDFPWLATACEQLKAWLARSATFLSVDDLYCPYRGGVLTIAETSALMTAVAKELPMLGIRLLFPRYAIHTILKCLELFSTRADFATFLSLPPGLWEHLVQKDCIRSEQEDKTAPNMFIEPPFEYRMPTQRFPIDRLCEDFLSRNQVSMAFINNSVWMGPDRIRGGGPTKAGGKHASGKYLIDLPQSEWNDVLVKGLCKGEAGSTTALKFTGRVKFPAGSSWSADMKVDVSVFKIESKGKIKPYILQNYPKKLKLVHELPEAARKAEPEYRSEEKPSEPQHGEGQLKPAGVANDSCDKGEMGSIQAHPTQNSQLPSSMKPSDPPRLNHKSKMLHDSVNTQPVVVERTSTLENQAKAAAVKSARTEEKKHSPETRTVMATENTEQEAPVKPAAATARRCDDADQSEATAKPAAVVGHPKSDASERGCNNNDPMKKPTPQKRHANELIGRLCNSQKRSTLPLGFLPDGRPLYWFGSDPHALFVAPLSAMRQDDPISELALAHATQMYEKCVRKNFEQQRGLLSLRPSEPGTYSCFWGCKSEDEVGRCRSFASLSELRDHLRMHHSYIQEEATVVGDLVRVDDRTIVTGICCGLAAAACAKCAPLNVFNQTPFNNEHVVFSGDRLFSNQGRKLVIESLANQGEWDTSSLRLYMRLARLFQIADEKAHGLSKDEMIRAITSCCGRGGDQNDALSVRDPGCCRLGCERVLMTENDEYRDTGCLPIGDICLDDVNTYPTDCGDISIGDAKSMLLALVSSIPESIRTMKPSSKVNADNIVDHVSPQMQLWSEDGFDSWRLFVLGCRDVRSLGQAFVALVFSLNIELPEWWESEGIGWSPLQASYSLSSLLFHLQVFEAALMEFISISSIAFKADMNQHVPEDLISFPYDKQVSITLERAKEVGLDRFKGDYQYYCSICQDGGDVLCCELCCNVGHASCYKLTDGNVDDFVCFACMTDVATVHSKEVAQKRTC